MQSKIFIFGLIFIGIFLVTCGGASKKAGEQMKKKQYIVQGKQIYRRHCANCHQKKGEGLRGLYPPLANADYLMNNLKRAICIIKNGKDGEIMVNGMKYDQIMPASGLSDLEIAELITYISNSWGNKSEDFIDVKKVSTWLTSCNPK